MLEAAHQLKGRRAVVATAGLDVGSLLAQGLRRHGAEVVEASSTFASLNEATKAMADAAEGGIDLIVHAGAEAEALASRPLHTLSFEQWHSAVHRSMLASVFCLQAAYQVPRKDSLSIVLVGPSTSLVGAAGLVPLITLAEAQRTLVKSAARQWGGHGIRVNWVGVAAPHYAAALADAALPATPELGPPPPALGRAPEPRAGVADVIAWLGSDGARGVTGMSFNLDGGDWMVP